MGGGDRRPQDFGSHAVLPGQLFPYPPPKGHPGQSLNPGLNWDLSICTCVVSQWLAGPCPSP